MARPVCSTLSLTVRTARNAAEIADAAALYEHSGTAAFSWRPYGHFQAQDFVAFAQDEEVWLALMGNAPERAPPKWSPVRRQGARPSNDEEAVREAERRELPLLGILSLFRPENFIHCLYVAPDAQRLGIGRALVDHVRKVVGAPLTLKLDVPNRRAIAFYEATGWERMTGLDDQGVDDFGIKWARYRLA